MNSNNTPSTLLLFGPQPWESNPAPTVGSFILSYYYFATKSTADALCQIIELGCGWPKGSCQVIETYEINPAQSQANQMIQLPERSRGSRPAQRGADGTVFRVLLADPRKHRPVKSGHDERVAQPVHLRHAAPVLERRIIESSSQPKSSVPKSRTARPPRGERAVPVCDSRRL